MKCYVAPMLWSLMACSGQAVQAPEVVEVETVPPEPRVEEPVEVLPGRLEGVNRVDELVFWGWSQDGRYYAFQTRYDGSGAVACDAQVDLIVVDADTDTYADGGLVEGRYVSPEADVCSSPSPTEQADRARPALFERYGIVVGSGSKLTRVERGVLALGPARYSVEMRPTGEAENLGFVLKLGERVLEGGKRKRPFTFGYEPMGAWTSPDGSHAAFLVQRRRRDFEGQRWAWMTNGFRL